MLVIQETMTLWWCYLSKFESAFPKYPVGLHRRPTCVESRQSSIKLWASFISQESIAASVSSSASEMCFHRRSIDTAQSEVFCKCLCPNTNQRANRTRISENSDLPQPCKQLWFNQCLSSEIVIAHLCKHCSE